MTHLLDTNSCVDHLRRGRSSNVTIKLAAAVPGSVVLCSIVVAELLYGAHRSARKTQTLSQVQSSPAVELSEPLTAANGWALWLGIMADFPHLLPSIPLMPRAYEISSRMRVDMTACTSACTVIESGCPGAGIGGS